MERKQGAGAFHRLKSFSCFLSGTFMGELGEIWFCLFDRDEGKELAQMVKNLWLL